MVVDTARQITEVIGVIDNMTRTWDKAPDIAIHTDREIKGFFGDYRWLSNFYLCPVRGKIHTYPSSENAYQASKWSPEFREQFVTITPDKSKKLGKLGNLYTKPQWDKVKEDIMYKVVLAKFSQNDDLCKLLIDTKDKLLEERNWWGDRFWGTDTNGNGENTLGKILMKVRKLCIDVQHDD